MMTCSRALLLALCLVLATSACSPEGRHRVLTIFFTGVPPLGWEIAEREAAAQQRLIAAQGLPARYTAGGFVHGPYGARECASCHVMQPPRNPGEKSMRIVVAEFVRPRHDLCSACHLEKSTDRARTDGLWRHGPTGNCLGCHHPHASGEPALLRRPAGEICLSCHGEGLIHTSELHAGLSDCLSCHNAHLGSNPMLLKADHVESF